MKTQNTEGSPKVSDVITQSPPEGSLAHVVVEKAMHTEQEMKSEFIGALTHAIGIVASKAGEASAMTVMRLEQLMDRVKNRDSILADLMDAVDELATALQHESAIEQRGLTTVSWEALETARAVKHRIKNGPPPPPPAPGSATLREAIEKVLDQHNLRHKIVLRPVLLENLLAALAPFLARESDTQKLSVGDILANELRDKLAELSDACDGNYYELVNEAKGLIQRFDALRPQSDAAGKREGEK